MHSITNIYFILLTIVHQEIAVYIKLRPKIFYKEKFCKTRPPMKIFFVLIFHRVITFSFFTLLQEYF